MSKQSDLSTAHLARLEALRNKHQEVQEQIDENLKRPPTNELETYIKSKKLEKLKIKEEIEVVKSGAQA